MNPTLSYTLNVNVPLSRPKIWRRIAVPSSIELPGLHEVIRIAMGASAGVQHFFFIHKKTVYARQTWDDLPRILSAENVVLANLLREPGDDMLYFCGDDETWEHTVELVRSTSQVQAGCHAVCVAGNRAYPGSPLIHGGRLRLERVNRALRKIRISRALARR
jgi:hypothetical protein